MTLDDEIQRQPDHRGEKLLAEIKRNRVVPGQFRLGTIFIATLVVALVLAIPRVAGWRYEQFFGLLWVFAFMFSPLVALSVQLLFPRLTQRQQIVVTVATFALATIPFLIYYAWTAGRRVSVFGMILGGMVFWGMQAFFIWVVWFVVFRSRRP